VAAWETGCSVIPGYRFTRFCMNDSAIQQRYGALLVAVQNLFALTNLEELVDHVLKHSRVMMEAEACTMFLPDPVTRELIIYSARGRANPVHESRIPWDKGVAGLVFHGHKFMRVDDALNDPRVLQIPDCTGFVSRSLLCAPLADKEECFGVIQVLNPVGRAVFTQLDQEIFEGLTNIVTGALVRFDREKRIDFETNLAKELDLARDIQKSYLPPEEICFPKTEMHVRYQPARTIGGDFYACIPLPGDRLLAAIGDVSGKGIPAALTTAQITTEMLALAPVAKEGLAAYVMALNTILCRRLAAGRFTAITFLLHDPLRETMEIICAGQFEPLRQRGDVWETVEVPHAMALGIFSGVAYQATEVPCLPGEKFVLYTDGINEGRSASGEDFGLDRLRVSLGAGGTSVVLDHAWDAWESFTDSGKQHDDACLLLLNTVA